MLVHLGVRIDRVPGPAAGVEDQRQRFFVVVIDEHPLFRELQLPDQLDRADGALLLVAVRRVDQDRQVEVAGQLDLPREPRALRRRSDRRIPPRPPPPRRPWRDSAAAAPSLRRPACGLFDFLRVEADGAEVADAELRGAEPLPADQAVEVVHERCRLSCAAAPARTTVRRAQRCRPPPSRRSRRSCATSCGRAGRSSS